MNYETSVKIRSYPWARDLRGPYDNELYFGGPRADDYTTLHIFSEGACADQPPRPTSIGEALLIVALVDKSV